MPQLKKAVIVVDKVSFQHKVDIPYVSPLITPIVPITPTTIASTSLSIVSNDEDDRKNLISSLRKLFEKNKTIKSLEKTLGEVLDRMQRIVKSTIT